MAFLRFNSLCVKRVGGLKMLWLITGYGLSQYGLSQYGLSQYGLSQYGLSQYELSQV